MQSRHIEGAGRTRVHCPLNADSDGMETVLKQKNVKKPEILAPAGCYQALLAAVEGGADAVYLGAQKFNARASADNFDGELLPRALAYCHAHGVSVYVTMNTLLYDRELDEAVSMAIALRDMGVDALIVADIGLVTRLRSACPDLPVHISTQATVHSADGVRQMADLGAERVVVARELSEQDLARLMHDTEGLPTEIEVFVHGAHCVSVSGQCLFSSLVGGRSGNRGECAQPCRLPYGKGYPLSLKDLSLAAHVPSLMAMGVDSFKIEGRLKSPYYVYTVTRIFRRLVDEGRAANDGEMRTLAECFSRGGSFTDGYFKQNHKAMGGVRTDADKAKSRYAEQGYVPAEKKAAVKMHFSAIEGEPISLTIEGARGGAHIESAFVPQRAAKAPASVESVTRQLCKLGDTPLTASLAESTFSVGDGLFIPVSALNELRRAACRALLMRPLKERRPLSESRACACKGGEADAVEKSPFVVVATSYAQFLAVRRFFDSCARKPLVFLSYDALLDMKEGLPLPDGVCLPPVVTDSDREEVAKVLCRLHEAGVTYGMVDNVGGYRLAHEASLTVFGGLRLNLTNRDTCEYLRRMGGACGILSPEVNMAQARDMQFGLLPIYGRMPLMLTERCFTKDTFGCEKCGEASLTDRRGVCFPVLRIWRHRNVILNSRPTYMLDRQDEMRRRGLDGGALFFTVESEAETLDVLHRFVRKLPPDSDVRRI